MNSPQEQLEEAMIYFSAVPAVFGAAVGETTSIAADEVKGWTFQDNPVDRSKPLAHLGPGYEKTVVVNVPAQACVPPTPAGAQLPPILSRPLIKVKSTANGVLVQGYASGVRSGLIKLAPNLWIRLKGCGNNDAGITTRKAEVPKLGQCDEVRGVMFDDTCPREQYLSALVLQALTSKHLIAANKPIGWYEYTAPEQPFPKIRKFCGLHETLGDRRLGTHLIIGLEKLLPVFSSPQAVEKAALSFPAQRKGSFSQATWVATLEGTPLHDATNDDLAFDLLSTETPSFVSRDLVAKWSVLVRELIELMKESKFSGRYLARLYKLIGVQSGRILRCLHDNQINWGSYSDLLGFHCNAHPNNFIILPPAKTNEGGGLLLAPLDFDLAFFHASFKLPQEKWGELLEVEKGGMAGAMAGDPEANSGADITTPLPAEFEIFRWALRDTMVDGFLQAYQGMETGGELSADKDPAFARSARILVELALITTSHTIA